MNLEQINDAIRTKGEKVQGLSAQLALAATQPSPDLKEVSRLQDELNRENSALQALKLSAESMTGEQSEKLSKQPAAASPAQERSLKEIRKSNEYARSFAYSLRNGLTPKTGWGVEQLHPLYDALTIGGGDPVGTDGGFLVPEDIDHTIHEQMRALNPLRDFFATEPVSANSGWRVKDNAPTTGFTAVNETATISRNDQPPFATVSYTLTKYGLILPVSNELVADEVANLFAYLARWGAKKQIITENTLLLAALSDLASSAVEIAPVAEYKGIVKLLNVSLDPAIAARAVFITNQDGYNVMDTMEDMNGRPMMQPDPTQPTRNLFKGHRVCVVSNAVMPSTTVGDKTTAPLFVGDGEEFATLFERAPMEMLSTSIGGDAFDKDCTNVRYIKRMGVNKFDTAAMKMAKLEV